MTAEELAVAITHGREVVTKNMVGDIAMAIQKAVLAERERCAKQIRHDLVQGGFCDEWDADYIANQIRSG